MFIICRDAHLGFYWDMKAPVFLEEKSAIFSSRKQCLEYLITKCKMEKEQAVSAIVSIQKSGCWVSF